MQLRLTVLVCLLILVGSATAGEYNPVLDIGDAAPTWEKLPGVDGKLHSASDLKEKQAVVVVFTCNSCPYASDYEGRLKDFVKQHAGPDSKVALVAVNVNKVDEDLLPAMKEKAASAQFNFPYLFDESQEIARKFGAGYTPECFVLNKDRKVVYMGAFDDSPMADKVEKQYVVNAVAAALKNEKPAVTETVPIGCRIRFERKRRSRD